MTKKIIILCGPEFHDLELFYPKYRLEEEGFEVLIAGIGDKSYRGKFGIPVMMDGHIKEFNPKEIDAAIIPGGWAPDKIRMCTEALEFIKNMDSLKKPIASICHGAWVLASAKILKGKKLTCYEAIKDDIINAGGRYVDEIVVVDGNLITSRKPDDLPYFCKELIRLLQ